MAKKPTDELPRRIDVVRAEEAAKPKEPFSKPIDPYMPLKEAVALLGLAEQTIRELAERGDLDSIKDVNGQRRYDRDSVARYLAFRQMSANARENRRSREDMAKRIAEARKNVIKP